MISGQEVLCSTTVPFRRLAESVQTAEAEANHKFKNSSLLTLLFSEEIKRARASRPPFGSKLGLRRSAARRQLCPQFQPFNVQHCAAADTTVNGGPAADSKATGSPRVTSHETSASSRTLNLSAPQ